MVDHIPLKAIRNPIYKSMSCSCIEFADGPNLKAANRETSPLYNQVSSSFV